MSHKRKIIQITNHRSDERYTDEIELIALCNDGSLWALRQTSKAAMWKRLDDIPQTDDKIRVSETA